MPAIDAEMFLDAITILEAQEMMYQLKIQDYPYSKDAVRSKLHRELKNSSDIKFLNKNKETNSSGLSLADFAKVLASR